MRSDSRSWMRCSPGAAGSGCGRNAPSWLPPSSSSRCIGTLCLVGHPPCRCRHHGDARTGPGPCSLHCHDPAPSIDTGVAGAIEPLPLDIRGHCCCRRSIDRGRHVHVALLGSQWYRTLWHRQRRPLAPGVLPWCHRSIHAQRGRARLTSQRHLPSVSGAWGA